MPSAEHAYSDGKRAGLTESILARSTALSLGLSVGPIIDCFSGSGTQFSRARRVMLRRFSAPSRVRLQLH